MARERGGDRPLYMISVAAELAGMHPQTLRIYEPKALIRPQRSAGNTRLYSEADVERLRCIQQLTQDEGVNLAGVVRIMALQEELERTRIELERMRQHAESVEQRIAEEAARIHQSYKAEMVLVRRGGLVHRERG
jgi:MerR family transcriptional regulator, heat shock protein HspR